MNSFEYGFFDELEKIAEYGLDKEAASLKQRAAAALLAGASLFGIGRSATSAAAPAPTIKPEFQLSAIARHVPAHGSPRYPFYVGPEYYRAAITPSSVSRSTKAVKHGGNATPMPGRRAGSPDYSPHDLEMLKREIIRRPPTGDAK